MKKSYNYLWSVAEIEGDFPQAAYKSPLPPLKKGKIFRLT